MQRGLVDAAGSPVLADLLGRLYDMTNTVGRRVLVISDRTRYGLRDHRSVLAALRAGDADAAERLRRTTIANIKEAVERYYTFLV
jgi:DNA-binding GntR family transcriptional regulator